MILIHGCSISPIIYYIAPLNGPLGNGTYVITMIFDIMHFIYWIGQHGTCVLRETTT